jgi:hypothetical protein
MPRKTGQPDIGESTADRERRLLEIILGEEAPMTDPDPDDLQSDA